MGKRIIVGATGASGMPVLVKCLELIGEQPEYESYLIMSDSAVLTLGQETNLSVEQVEALADHVLQPDQIGAGPASGSFATAGMLVVQHENHCRNPRRICGEPDSACSGRNHQGAEDTGSGSQGDSVKSHSFKEYV